MTRITLRPGQSACIAGKWWGVCARCLNLVRIDKPLIGSAHICVPPEDDQ
jgi:hypothetical protein